MKKFTLCFFRSKISEHSHSIPSWPVTLRTTLILLRTSVRRRELRRSTIHPLKILLPRRERTSTLPRRAASTLRLLATPQVMVTETPPNPTPYSPLTKGLSICPIGRRSAALLPSLPCQETIRISRRRMTKFQSAIRAVSKASDRTRRNGENILRGEALHCEEALRSEGRGARSRRRRSGNALLRRLLPPHRKTRPPSA